MPKKRSSSSDSAKKAQARARRRIPARAKKRRLAQKDFDNYVSVIKLHERKKSVLLDKMSRSGGFGGASPTEKDRQEVEALYNKRLRLKKKVWDANETELPQREKDILKRIGL